MAKYDDYFEADRKRVLKGDIEACISSYVKLMTSTQQKAHSMNPIAFKITIYCKYVGLEVFAPFAPNSLLR